MEENVRLLLAELEEWGRGNDERATERSGKMLNLEPETARLLSLLVQHGGHRRLLEVGTSNGYSTIWLAWSAQQTGGHLTSIEHSRDKQEMAKANLERAGLLEHVTLLLGDATQVISQLDEPFDFVFLDADRHQYLHHLPLLLPRMPEGALLLADNVQSHPDEIGPYLEAIEAIANLQHTVVGVGKGLSIALKR